MKLPDRIYVSNPETIKRVEFGYEVRRSLYDHANAPDHTEYKGCVVSDKRTHQTPQGYARMGSHLMQNDVKPEDPTAVVIARAKGRSDDKLTTFISTYGEMTSRTDWPQWHDVRLWCFEEDVFNY